MNGLKFSIILLIVVVVFAVGAAYYINQVDYNKEVPL